MLAACRFYHALLPFLFERLDDETELLLPDDLLTEHSVVQGFRSEITDEDCAEVEILGWLYQFYISEKKDQVMARKSGGRQRDIPAVTQLFTPHWIVRYLVENSLGRLWLLLPPRLCSARVHALLRGQPRRSSSCRFAYREPPGGDPTYWTRPAARGTCSPTPSISSS